MRKVYVLIFVLLSLRLVAQTPVTEVYHGCGGATVVSYGVWPNVTYEFQRQTGITWTTVHTTVNPSNWHLVLNGDISGPTAYRCKQINPVTGEERISNGVTVDPALFFRAVQAPGVNIKPIWSSTADPSDNGIEVTTFGTILRPPFKVEYKKLTDPGYQVKYMARGLFISNTEPNTNYEVKVTDHCGNSYTKQTSGPQSVLFTKLTSLSCAGGTLKFSLLGSDGLDARAPFTFGIYKLPGGGTAYANPNGTYTIPENVLNNIIYNISADSVSNVQEGTYVCRGVDKLGVKTTYAVISVGGPSEFTPFVTGYGATGQPCEYYLTFSDPGGVFGPWSIGKRPKGSNAAYTFSTNFARVVIPLGVTYEIVLANGCNTQLSTPIEEFLNPEQARIEGISYRSYGTGCRDTIQINAVSGFYGSGTNSLCIDSVSYGLVEKGKTDTVWQRSKIFAIPRISKEYIVLVKDLIWNATNQSEFSSAGLTAELQASSQFGECSNLVDLNVINMWNGQSPFLFQYSFDGESFSQPNSLSDRTGMPRGIYDVRITDACGGTLEKRVSIASTYYLKESGVITQCTTNGTLGGYLSFGLKPLMYQTYTYDTSRKKIRYELFDSTSSEGWKTVRTGTTADTILTLRGLEGNRYYKLGLRDSCGKPFFVENRGADTFFVPATSLPAVDLALPSGNCNPPVINVWNYPAGSLINIYKGKGTEGETVSHSNGQTENLDGGWYTIWITNDNINGCSWEYIREVFIKVHDKLIGQPNDTLNTVFCQFTNQRVSMYDFFPEAAPDGAWQSTPAIIWEDQAKGVFVPAKQSANIYQITYVNADYCNWQASATKTIEINTSACEITILSADLESAQLPLGCKTYSGNSWNYISDQQEHLALALNPGTGNNLQRVCWGLRTTSDFSPRTAMIAGAPVYFANRNYYVEPFNTNIGSAPVKVKLYFSNSEIQNLLGYLQSTINPAITVNDLRILKKSSGPGSPVDLDITAGPAGLYRYITPVITNFGADWVAEFELTGFSELALVYSTGSFLPLTWLSMNARMDNGGVRVDWSTSSESNTDRFFIEHSTDGNVFRTLGSVKAAGNSNSIRTYRYDHAEPAYGRNHYRIRQTDKDGKYSYSKTASLTNDRAGSTLRMVPNPVIGKAWLEIPAGLDGGTATIYDHLGRIHATWSIPDAARRLDIDLSGYATGVYLIRVTKGQLSETVRLVKN